MSFTVKHKRTSNIGRRPKGTDLEDGQLGLNINNSSPGAFFRTSAGEIVKIGPAHVGDSEPYKSNWVEPSLGELWLDTSPVGGSVLRIWNGTIWDTTSPVANIFVPPTSPTGLPSGAVYNSNGTLQIVP